MLHGLVAERRGDATTGRIAPEQQTAIFDPFTQVDRRLDRPHDGVGLGLAISRDMARAMDAELSVETEPGRGSTFALSLPRPYPNLAQPTWSP